MSVRLRHPLAWSIAALSLVLGTTARADYDRDRDHRERDRDRNFLVDCAAGDTIARALRYGDERKSLLLRVRGTCVEHVTIDRSDVTLKGDDLSATISGPDGGIDVIRVTGSRVVIEALRVTGGRNGITADSAPGLIVRGAVVQGTGRNGITYAHGASGVVNGSVVTGNARDGVAIDSAAAAVINSQITLNARMGVGVFNGGAGRIGVNNFNAPGGNVISANASNGIHIVFGSTALIAMNQVTGNGTSADPAALKIGINLASASADFIGGNTISGNVGNGVNLVRSSAVFGDAIFTGITTVNTITRNGNAVSQGGIFAFNGSSITLRDAIIEENVGFGLSLSLKSSGQIASSTIRNNLAVGPGTGDGIRLVFGSGLFASAPNGSITGNAGFGVNCTDGESSVINTGLLGISGNALGGVAPGCTGF